MDIHVDFSAERWKEPSSIFCLFLCCYSHSLAPAAQHCCGWRLRELIATGTEFIPLFPLFLPLGCSLWFSLETQRHTCTKPYSLSADRTALMEAHFDQCQQRYEQEQPAKAGALSAPDRNGRLSPGNTCLPSESCWETSPLSFFSLSFCYFHRSNFYRLSQYMPPGTVQALLKLCSREPIFCATLPIAKLYPTARNITSSAFELIFFNCLFPSYSIWKICKCIYNMHMYTHIYTHEQNLSYF